MSSLQSTVLSLPVHVAKNLICFLAMRTYARLAVCVSQAYFMHAYVHNNFIHTSDQMEIKSYRINCKLHLLCKVNEMHLQHSHLAKFKMLHTFVSFYAMCSCVIMYCQVIA